MNISNEELFSELQELKQEHAKLRASYLNNLSELKSVRESFHKSEENYQNLVSSMIQGFALHEIICNENGQPVDYRFITANKGFENLTGLKPEKIINKTVLEVLPGTEKYWIEKYGHVAITGEPAHFENYSHDLGKYYEVVAFSPEKNYFAVLITDITRQKQVNDELRIYHTRLELTMLATDMAWWEMDVVTGNVIFHKRKAEMLGYQPEEFSSYDDFKVLIHPDDLNNTVNAMKFHIEGKNEKYDVVYRIKTRAGDYNWFHEIGGIVEWNSNGQPTKVTGVVIDITEHKKAELKLNESEKQYRLLIETAHEGIMVAQENRIKFINPKIAEMTGYSEEEFSSLPFLDFVHQNDKLLVRKNYENRVNGEIVDPRYNFRIIKKDGEIKWVEMSGAKIEWMGKPATLNFVNDITDRKKAEELISQGEFKLKKAEEVAKLGNWTFYINEKIIKSSRNARKIYGFNETDNSIEQTRSVVLKEYQPILERAVFDLLTKKEPQEIEYKIKRKTDGKIIDIYSKAEYDETNNAIFGIIQDITERKVVEEALRESEKNLQTIFKVIGTGILLINSENQTIIDANETAASFIGYPKDYLIGKVCHEFICSNIVGQCPVKDLKKTVENCERKLLCANNEQKDILKTVFPIKYQGINCYL